MTPDMNVKRTVLFTLLIAALCCTALASCHKKEEEAAQEQTEQQQQIQQSVFLQPSDSLRWLSYLGFSPQDTALAYLMLGTLYLANKYPRQALNYLETASRYDVARPIIYLNIGCAYNDLGDYAKAIEAFQMFVQRDPGSILSQEIFRIVEKYRSLQSNPDTAQMPLAADSTLR